MTDEICHGVRYAVIPDAMPAQAAQHPCIDRPLAHPAQLRWSAGDPWAVELRFPAVGRQHKPVTWVFALDLLEHGLGGPTGAWNVRIRPVPGYRIEMVLDSPTGQGVLHFSTVEIRTFLEAVPAVWEDVEFDDAELAAWLARAES